MKMESEKMNEIFFFLNKKKEKRKRKGEKNGNSREISGEIKEERVPAFIFSFISYFQRSHFLSYILVLSRNYI